MNTSTLQPTPTGTDHRTMTASVLFARCACAVVLALLCVLLVTPPLALADAPVTRGPETQGQGSVGTAPAGSTADATSWRTVQELPLPSMPAPSASSAPPVAPLQQDGAGSGAIAWLGRQLNPGNWILDAGMGIFAGIIKMFGGMVQKSVQAFVGSSVLPGGCDNAATNFVFCTPPSLTYDHPGVQTVWGLLSAVASGLVTVLFTVRLGRMIVEGPRSLAAEGKSLVLTFIVAMAFIQATHPACKLIIDFFNGLSHLLLSQASFQFPTEDVGGLDFGAVVLFLVLWAMILILIIKSFTRLVQIIILIAVAPLAGALLMDRSTSARFRSWFEKLIELLVAQLNLVIIFIVIAAILQPFAGQGVGDQFVAFLLSIVAIGMALSGKSMVGFAGAAVSGGGGGMLAFLRYQVAGTAMRGLMGGRGRAEGSGRAGSAGGGTDPHLQQGVAEAQRAAHDARARSTRASGDPAQSAAAGRQAGGGTPRPSSAFRMSDASDTFSTQRANSRYAAAEQAPRDSHGRLPRAARREQALMRSTMMRERASELRGQGDEHSAAALDRKAQRQAAFGRGRDIARPSRFTDTDRAQRRSAYAQALAEVRGMHDLERDTLTQQIGKDEERLPALQRELAMAGATGGNTTTLHEEEHAITTRLAHNRARVQALAPVEDGRPSRATRAAAAALANDRLPQPLRSRDYALRYGAAGSTPFVQTLANTPTQDGRDELARSRAYTVQVAQTPPEQRAPIASARRRNDPRRKQWTARPTPDSNAGSDETASGSRAPSATIARLRARKRRTDQDDVER
jgi:hypothetical protein